MDPVEFPSNSSNPLGAKQPLSSKEAKNVAKVTTGEVIQKQKSLGRRFKAIFSGADGKGAVKYILGDVLLPAAKNMIVDAVSKGVERFVYGDAPRRRYQGIGPRVSYNSPVERYSRHPGILPDQPPLRDSRQRQPESGEIILISRGDADLVLERLTDIIDKYEVASLADLHELVGLPSSHIDHKWGWQVLTFANVRQVREGYLLDLPAPEPIS